jgi:hypothetical protein
MWIGRFDFCDVIAVDDTCQGIKSVKENILVDKRRVDLYEAAFAAMPGAWIMFAGDDASK